MIGTPTIIPVSSLAHSALTGVGATDHVAESTKAQMQNETAGDTRVPPDLVKDSRGVAKGWADVDGAGNNLGSHGVDATGKDTTGEYTITWSVNFDGIHVDQVTVENAGARMGRVDARAVGTSSVETMDNTFANVDVAFMIVSYGDQ